MQTILLSREKVARRARQLYKNNLRQQVETNENIGKMVIIGFESGDYKVDGTGVKSSPQAQYKTSTFPSLRQWHLI